MELCLGIARCFTFGGSRNRVLHDPQIKPRSDLSKDKYMNKEEQTTVNHFHEKLLKLKELTKTKVYPVKQKYVDVPHIIPHMPSARLDSIVHEYDRWNFRSM